MNRSSFSRLKIAGIIFSIFAFIIVAQIVRIQNSLVHRELSDSLEENLAYETRTIYPDRGNIYDRWGHLLAGNIEVYEVGINLKDVCNPRTIAEAAQTLLGMNYDEAFADASIPYDPQNSVYWVLTDYISAETISQLENLMDAYEDTNPGCDNEEFPSLEGLTWRVHMTRAYPENTLASNVLGFYSREGVGQFGIEESYDALLSGTPVEFSMPMDPSKITEVPTIPPGASLVLTLDREIQAMVEDTLDKAVADNGAQSGTAIVMDPNTGEILAMATTPHLNLNEYWDYNEIFRDQNKMFNNAVTATYEPGSIFKILTMAAALDAGTVTPETPFLDTGVYTIGGWNIYNWNRGAWGQVDMIGCMQHSLNVCLSWIADQMGKDLFYQYIQAFGIGKPTNVDLADEATYPLLTPNDNNWYEVNLGTNSFGQGVSVTPIEIVSAISAVANDGRIMQPHLVKAIIQDGQQYDISPKLVATPIKPETARTLTNMLAISLEEESSIALVDGYRLAGKTGTAEIAVEGEYLDDLTNASFIGWGPVDDPQFIVYVWLEKPTTSPWGSVVAAPVFSDIVRQLVVLMDIPPDEARQALASQ